MSKKIDAEKLAVFIKSRKGKAKTNIYSGELKEALKAGDFASGLTKGPYVWHKHGPPICALHGGVPHTDPSCVGRGQHALCTYGFSSDGMCNCAHWPRRGKGGKEILKEEKKKSPKVGKKDVAARTKSGAFKCGRCGATFDDEGDAAIHIQECKGKK